MATKEIITLQLGHYANFIGTHWWNIQESSFQYRDTDSDANKEEVDHDVLFREGQTNRGEITFTPRLVLAELKGGLGSLKSSAVLYEEEGSKDSMQMVCWDGHTTVHKEQPPEQSKFLMDLEQETELGKLDSKSKGYNLDQNIKVWSDCLRPYLHPKSIVIVNEYNHLSENDPFDLWTKGMNLGNVCEELEERIRFYAEECDRMQGFHIISDIHTGFAGLATSLMRYLHDEFSSKDLVVYPSQPAETSGDSKVKKIKRHLTQSLSLSGLLQHSSLVCPLSLATGDLKHPGRHLLHLLYNAGSKYHTSAILAAGLDTATMRYRLKDNAGFNLQEFVSSVTSMTKRLVSMSLSLPLPLAHHKLTAHHDIPYDIPQFLNRHMDNDPWTSISPITLDGDVSQPEKGEYYAQYLTLRGIPEERVWTAGRPNSFWEARSLSYLLRQYVEKRFYGCSNTVHTIQDRLLTKVPFPQIFSADVGQEGFLVPNIPQIQHTQSTILRNGQSNCNGSDCNTMNGQASNGHDVGEHPVHALNISKHCVESTSAMTNIQCSSRSMSLLKSAAQCLIQGRKRHFSFHLVENENLVDEIEHLRSLQDEYKNVYKMDSSDSDEDF